MPFRKTVPISDLGKHLSQEEIDEQATTYQASRGGWFKAPAKPVPGTPKTQQGGRS